MDKRTARATNPRCSFPKRTDPAARYAGAILWSGPSEEPGRTGYSHSRTNQTGAADRLGIRLRAARATDRLGLKDPCRLARNSEMERARQSSERQPESAAWRGNPSGDRAFADCSGRRQVVRLMLRLGAQADQRAAQLR
jgi:hypothetical protein